MPHPTSEPPGADTRVSSRLERAAESARAGSDIPALEWVIAIVGLVIVAATIGFIAYQGLTRADAPPELSLKAGSIVEVHGGYLVKLHAFNRGGATAADVKVEGVLNGKDGTVETSEMAFKYLPPRSEREGGLYFKHDPRQGTLSLTAKGYEAP